MPCDQGPLQIIWPRRVRVSAVSLERSTLRSRTPADDQASTGAGTAASFVMSTLRSETPSVNQAPTETGYEASFVMSTRASMDPSDHKRQMPRQVPGLLLLSRPSTSRTISQASVSDAITRLQQEKARVQKELDNKRAAYNDLNNEHIRALSHNEVLVKDIEKQRQLINSLQRDLGDIDAKLDDDDDDDSYTRSIKHGCERLKRFTSEMNKKLESQ